MRLSKKLDFLGVSCLVLCGLSVFLGTITEEEVLANILFVFDSVLCLVAAALAICRLMMKKRRRRFRPDKSLRVKTRRRKIKNAPSLPSERKEMTPITALEDYEENSEPQGFAVDEEVIEETNPEKYQTFAVRDARIVRKRVKKK
jgi:hypothetical protein